MKLAPVALAGAVAALLFGGAAYAAPPASLPPLVVSPATVVPDGEILLTGAGCVGTGGTPGVVIVTLQNPDGTTLTDEVTDIDANGGWAAQYTAPNAAASYTVAASCDLYGSTLTYPAATVTVSVGGGSAPPAGAELDRSPGSSTAGGVAGDDLAGTAVDDPAEPNAPAASSVPDQPGDDLSTTGSPLDDAGLIAGGLLLGGLGAVYAGRRRAASST
ncbi:hypothetical protein [Blastococcus sp. Marseille-P5729]|uniref:hypothetical protein n=1 Tax=Blastococcus sp. Marseille-P5729 TaxID=2086582 RepID=UPI000D104223|nr:hypothetical protein [Blastococcus sp. Marseille-P5729]